MKKLLCAVSVFGFIASLSVPALAQGTVTLNALIAAAKQNNAEITAAHERWNASRSRVAQAKTWDNPKLTFDYWGIPEGTFDVGAAPEKMYGITQMIPFPGKLSLRGKAAGSEAEAVRWEYRNVELKVLSELKSAYALYYYLDKSIETYRQTAEIMTNFSKVAESKYVVGQAAQGDVLRAQVEAEKMNTMVITLEQEQQAVRAQINLLLGRNVDEQLGGPEDLSARFAELRWDDLKALAARNNPEIGRSGANVEKGKWARRSAEAEYLPDFDVAFRRKTMDGQWAGSDLMVGVSVPLWFWKQRAGVTEMSAELKAAESEKRNTELMVLAQVRDAFTKCEAARRLIVLYSASVLPKSEQSLKVTQSAFTAGRSGFLELLDSVRSYLEFKLEYYKYVSEYQQNRAMLERTVGAELPDGGNQ